MDKKDYEFISSIVVNHDSERAIPEGATHFEFEANTDDCYYAGDTPAYTIHFYKKKHRTDE